MLWGWYNCITKIILDGTRDIPLYDVFSFVYSLSEVVKFHSRLRWTDKYDLVACNLNINSCLEKNFELSWFCFDQLKNKLKISQDVIRSSGIQF